MMKRQRNMRNIHFYKKRNSDKIWWGKIKGVIGPTFVSFDKKTVYNLWTDYPSKFNSEQKALFDNENPDWADLLN